MPHRGSVSQITITVVCCPSCKSIMVSRKVIVGSMSYWKCRQCEATWKQPNGFASHEDVWLAK